MKYPKMTATRIVTEMIRPKAPIVAQLELTDQCNHACIHCYNYWRSPDSKLAKRPTEDDVRVIKKISKAIVDGEVFHVVLSGGEPLLFRPKDLEQIISAYRDENVSVAVNSNITLATQEYCYIFRQHSVRVLTSVPSCDEKKFEDVTTVKGSYKRFLSKANMLAAAGIYLSGNMIVDKSRVGEVYETGRFVSTLGFQGFNATRISPANNTMIADYGMHILDNTEIRSMLDQLMQVKKDFGLNVATLNALPYCCVPNPEDYREIFNRSCGAGLTTAGISSKGDVRACQHFDISYGNILSIPLKDIWADMPVWKREYDANKGCEGCEQQAKCGGGCRENAYKTAGDMHGEDNLKKHGHGPIKRKWAPGISDIDEIRLKGNMRIRQEQFGATLFSTPSNYCFIDHFTNYAIQRLSSRDSMTKKDIMEIGSDLPYVNDSYVNRVFSSLVNNRVAKIKMNCRGMDMPCTNMHDALYRFPMENQIMGE